MALERALDDSHQALFELVVATEDQATLLIVHGCTQPWRHELRANGERRDRGLEARGLERGDGVGDPIRESILLSPNECEDDRVLRREVPVDRPDAQPCSARDAGESEVFERATRENASGAFEHCVDGRTRALLSRLLSRLEPA
jgi:hypothetical protein